MFYISSILGIKPMYLPQNGQFLTIFNDCFCVVFEFLMQTGRMFKCKELLCFTYLPFWASYHCIQHRIANSSPFFMCIFALHSNFECKQNACLNMKNRDVLHIFDKSNSSLLFSITKSKSFSFLPTFNFSSNLLTSLLNF